MEAGGEAAVRGLAYVRALRCFDEVVTLCFGVRLQKGYEESIDRFKQAYLDLDISVTPKVFILYLILFTDVKLLYIIGTYGLPTCEGVPVHGQYQTCGVESRYHIFKIIFTNLTYEFSGLGYYSEQAFESLHSDMKVRI